MPKWLRTLIFNTVRAYSFVRRAFYRVMDQLAAMLAKAAAPSGPDTSGSPISGASASAAPLLTGDTMDAPDREVCTFIIFS
jgi:hypothetical protein